MSLYKSLEEESFPVRVVNDERDTVEISFLEYMSKGSLEKKGFVVSLSTTGWKACG